MPEILISGAVDEDDQACIELDINGLVLQLDAERSSNLASDILECIHRAEAVATIVKFFESHPVLSKEAMEELLQEFGYGRTETNKPTVEGA